jgi:hypothetical protein
VQLSGGRGKGVTDLNESVLGLHSIKLCLQDNILDGVVAGWGQVGDGAPRLGWQHDVMLDEVVLLHNAVHVAASDVGADAQLPRLELPLLRHTENKGNSEIFTV